MRRGLAAGALALALCAGAARTRAQTDTPALNFESLGSGFDYTQGSYSLGWRFRTKQDTTVTALGFYDDLQDGLTESHPVAIYDRETRQALASTTVVPGDPLTGFFRFHPLTTPVTLRGGRDYFIFALTGTEHYAVAPSQLEISPFITFEGFAAADNNNGSQTTLTPPDDSSYGPVNNFHGDFGPSFKIADGTAPTTAAVDFPSLTGSYSSGMDAYAGPYSIGYHFRPNRDIQVATLGFYDDQMNGLTPSNSHSVAIYDAVMKVSVVDTHVTNADPLRGFFRYHPVANVTLKQGYDYFIMADSSGENYAQDVTDFIVDSSITQLGYAINTTAPTLGAEFPEYTDSTTPFFGPTFEILGNPVHPPFFTGEVGLANGVYYLSFADGDYFGYYSYLNPSTYIYHQDLGYEYVFDAADGNAGVYFYDFASGDYFYTSPSFPFPYLYDFTLNAVLYYYPDPNTPGHYNTAGVRYFYNLATGKIISR